MRGARPAGFGGSWYSRRPTPRSTAFASSQDVGALAVTSALTEAESEGAVPLGPAPVPSSPAGPGQERGGGARDEYRRPAQTVRG